ncbi:hypothetical protein [Sutcliffiella halmapala]|uniref:hypothetical protein n=1 Tax=Sutcliffiella halmapala TaxID=79882 RepID=UPI0011173927|nr:hypothetical protein [Sutcliffiella halmapala]
MKKLLFLFATLLFINGCGIQKQANEPGFPPAMTETQYDGEVPSDEDMIIGAKNQIRLKVGNENQQDGYYSEAEAKQLVKNHLKLQNSESVIISFEGFDNKDYLFHVYALVHFNNKPEKLTRGWYKVNPQSGKITTTKE